MRNMLSIHSLSTILDIIHFFRANLMYNLQNTGLTYRLDALVVLKGKGEMMVIYRRGSCARAPMQF
jgi:hypothetical protein